LGYVVSKEGITVDPERIAAILELPLPHHKKSLQSFIGKINFVRRFLPNIADLLKPLTAMLKKGSTFSWTKEGKANFQAIKEALTEAPALLNPNFEKDFILYAYGSHDAISAMLTQENLEGLEQPVAFFSKGLEEYEHRYSFVEKHVLAVVKSLKKFRYLLTHSKVHLKVTHPSVKEFLLSKDLNEKRAGWITKVMEYDVDIQTTKLVRGRGLCEHLAGDENAKKS
jgi:hypothetical protein